MRELISNSSEACDKLRYLAQTDSALIADDPEFKIHIKNFFNGSRERQRPNIVE